MFLIIIYIFLFSSIYNKNNIFFKFKKKYNDLLQFFLIDNEIQTQIKIGNPVQNIPLFIIFNEYLSIITNKSLGGDYNSFNSKTYKNSTVVDVFYFLNRGESFYGKNSYENIEFNLKYNYINNNKETSKIFNYSFILCSKDDKEYYTTNKKKNFIGLQYKIAYSEREQNFLFQLKENNYIQTYTFFINYPYSEIIFNIQNYEDFIYINYKLENFKIIVEFDKIEFNNETDYSNEVQIDFDFNGIISSKNFFEYINKTFFEKYYNSNICYDTPINYKDQFIIITCNKKEFNYKDFPKIFFYSKKLNKTFELNKNDLFIEKNNSIYFLIYYHKILFPRWVLGYPFLKNYQILFDPEKKIIGIPNKKFIMEKKKLNKIYLLIIFLIIIIILIILIFIKFCLIMKNKINRKIRANELEENYVYFSNQEYKKISS